LSAIGRDLDRREFVRLVTAGVAGITGVAGSGLISCADVAGSNDPSRGALRQPSSLSAAAATLTAAAGIAAIGDGAPLPAWLFNGGLPGPSLRARTGDQASITLVNGLPEDTIVHWHGLIVPELADGHPRQAIPPGTTYDYTFPIMQRAGTYWYHPHAHHKTAGQIYRGLAGFFIVADAEEEALQLPDGEREILLMLQDRRHVSNPLSYAPTPTDELVGLLGDVSFGNGIRLPALTVTADRYRFRVLNASQARVYCLALSNGAPLTVIGTDGGLLRSAVVVDSLFLGVGERADLLIDCSAIPPGERLTLKSLPFGGSSLVGEAFPQGMEMDLLELVVAGPGRWNDPPLPAVLSTIPALPPGGAATRDFVFTTHLGMHEINGTTFDILRVDEQIPLGQVERWRFINDSELPHPVHLHGTQFQIVSRQGGRNTVYPYEDGWKDTALAMPLETVEVLVRFDRYRGIFPMHCHNLQHEDMGMMLNIEVV
jgi:blue copper oxidase